MRLTHRFKFNAAHFLPNYDGDCKRLHGHTWECKITVAGDYNEETGMICDFKDLKRIINEGVISKLDHSLLNNIFENPTAENIVVWIFHALSDKLDMLQLAIARIELWESDNSSIVFDPVEEILKLEMQKEWPKTARPTL